MVIGNDDAEGGFVLIAGIERSRFFELNEGLRIFLLIEVTHPDPVMGLAGTVGRGELREEIAVGLDHLGNLALMRVEEGDLLEGELEFGRVGVALHDVEVVGEGELVILLRLVGHGAFGKGGGAEGAVGMALDESG